MSAFIVSDATIDALVTFAIGGGYDAIKSPRYHEADMTKRELGQLLVNENYRSVNARYRDEEGEPHSYVFKPYVKPLPAVTVLKLCSCYDYQACETEDYEKTRAAELINRIRSKAIHRLPGYDHAPWGLNDDDRSNAVCLSDLVGG